MSFVPKGYIPVFIALFYLISSVYAQTELIVSDEENTQNNSIKTNNQGNQISNIRVVLDHIFISNINNSLEISETVVFRNEGQEIYYSDDNHTLFAISTPPSIRDIKTQAMECCLVQDEGVIYMDPMQSLKSGENFEMKISYTIVPQGQEYVFNKSAAYNTTSLSIFVDKKSDLAIEGSDDIITLSGIEYNFIIFNDLTPGETIGIPVKITKEPDYKYVGIGFFLIFSICLVYFFKGKLKRKRTKNLTLEELELEKIKIFHTIYGFEKHVGHEKSDEYTKLMEEYRNKVFQIYFKMVSLKNNM
ncbi:MAG: hypothetical protein OIN87_12200 [Candidatus Methanoperedens sp.]|nr:hypothetical protein [Candidatus Methanoperedens sp.]